MSSFTLNNLRYTLLFIILLATSCRSDNHRHTTTSPPEIPLEEIMPCDLAFRLGRSLESNIIATKGGYSHIGVIIRKDSTLQVAHIEPSRDGYEQTKYESLNDFFHPDKSAAGCIMRIKDIIPEQYATIEGYLRSRKHNSFDHDYMLSDSSKMYCTELVHRAYMAIGLDLTQGIRHRVPIASEGIVLPSDIYQNEALTEIWSY